MTYFVDKRAHERITSLEEIVKIHLKDHEELEKGLKENTDLTRTISENTSELVTLIKGIKGFRGFMLWLAPFVAALSVVAAAMTAVYLWFKS